MKKTLATIFLISIALKSLADQHEKKDHEHGKVKSAHSHVHGAGKVEMAFEGLNGVINIEFPSDSVFGFEHAPKNDKQKKIVNDSLAKIDSNISEMIKFSADLKCAITKDSITNDADEASGHADVDGQFKVKCDKSIIGSEIEFNFQKTFPKLKKVEVVLIADAIQAKVLATKNGAKLKADK